MNIGKVNDAEAVLDAALGKASDFARWIAASWAAYRAKARRDADRRRTLEALRGLSDHTLRDIGLGRHNIASLEDW